MEDLKAARALGWASIAIAATEIIGQGLVETELLGIDKHPVLLPSLGVREAVAGVTILSQKKITPTLAAGLWSRVAGDAVDLSLLAIAAPHTRKPASFFSSTFTVLAITAIDLYYAARIQRRLVAENNEVVDRAAVRNNASPTVRVESPARVTSL